MTVADDAVSYAPLRERLSPLCGVLARGVNILQRVAIYVGSRHQGQYATVNGDEISRRRRSAKFLPRASRSPYARSHCCWLSMKRMSVPLTS